jgi:glutamate 5-kinase
MTEARSALKRARRIVVKIGSRALKQDAQLPERLATDLAALAVGPGSKRRAFVIVSSGSIALGRTRLGYRTRPKEMSRLQAAAAAGQIVLMRRYDEAFEAVGITPAQILLTHADLSDRRRLNNARTALAALLEAGAVPVINENDTVATEEIAFGDNDQLASMVVPLVGADALILLTDVEGVLGVDGERISTWTENTELGDVAQAPSSSREGSGGIQSKLTAARKASRSGANVVIASAATEQVLSQVLNGDDVGTLVPAVEVTLRARKHWIAFTLRPKGSVIVDEGAQRALRGAKSSLLPVGVVGVRGEFHSGDAVRIENRAGVEIGRGLARLSALDVARAAGLKGEALQLTFGPGASDWVIVHRDDLVLMGT